MHQANRYRFLGFNLDNLSLAETVQQVEEIVKKGTPQQHIVLNALKVAYAHANDDLRKIINDCAIVNADGQSVVWGARLLGIPIKERVAGIDLMQALLRAAEGKRWGVYFLGAQEEILQLMVSKLQKSYPNLLISGYRNGYFSTEDERSVVDDIKSCKPDILFIGISSPKKEIFLNKYLNELNIPFSMGVGGSFDIIAGKTKRAPRIIQRIGLEWLYRVYQEPKRVWKRYAKTNPFFIYLVLKEKFKRTLS